MGDAPLAFVETAGGVRVSEDDVVAVGKNDVSWLPLGITSRFSTDSDANRFCRSRSVGHDRTRNGIQSHA